jgi:hypothetical protein
MSRLQKAYYCASPPTNPFVFHNLGADFRYDAAHHLTSIRDSHDYRIAMQRNTEVSCPSVRNSFSHHFNPIFLKT